MVLSRIDVMSDHWWLRPGWTPTTEYVTVHVTFDGATALHDFVRDHQVALWGTRGIDLVPERWLHLTMQGVAFADEIAPATVAEIGEVARDLLAGVPAVDAVVGRPQVHRNGVVCDVTPTAKLAAVRSLVRRAIAMVLGPSRVPGDEGSFWPHVSLAYAAGAVPAARVIDALAGVGPIVEPHVRIRHVDVIRLRRDGHCYVWTPLVRLPLGRR